MLGVNVLSSAFSIGMLNAIMLNFIKLNFIMLNVIMLNVIMLNVIMLNVVMLIVVMLSIESPRNKLGAAFISFWSKFTHTFV
jgi:hypothetical protein